MMIAQIYTVDGWSYKTHFIKLDKEGRKEGRNMKTFETIRLMGDRYQMIDTRMS